MESMACPVGPHGTPDGSDHPVRYMGCLMTDAMGYHGAYHGLLSGILISQSMENRMGYSEISPMGSPSYKPWDGPWKLSSYGILH